MTGPAAASVGRAEHDPAIDGLRALAVALVLAFHVDAGLVPGGFIGVDVFFVISGFLITGLIQRQGDGFRFAAFYARRFRRLFPAVAATVAATLIAAPLVMNPIEVSRLGLESAAAALSVSNLLFWLQSGYFDAQAEFKPLLHTWSLGVEEQFYLVWPLVVVFAGRWRRGGLAWALGGLGAASLAAAFLLQREAAGAVFFLTPFRVFQFALGGLIAVHGLRFDGVVGALGGGLGATALLALGVTLDGADAGVGLAMLAPAAAAGLLIASSRAAGVAALFGSPVLTWIGRRSYSIYLVHWPIVVLWRMAGSGELSAAESAGLAAASTAAGAVLHWAVEARFRRPPTARARAWVHAGTAAGLAVAVAAGSTLWLRPDLATGAAAARAAIDTGDLRRRRTEMIRADVCNLRQVRDLTAWDRDTCFAMSDDRPNWLILGDSYAADAYALLAYGVPEVNFVQATMRGCPPFPPDLLATNARRACVRFARFRLEELAADERLAGVVLAANWKPGYLQPLAETAARLEARGVDVVVFGQRAVFRQEAPMVLTEDPERAHLDAPADLDPGVAPLRDALRDRYEGRVLDMFALQCRDGVCPIVDAAGAPLYIDTGHFSHAAPAAFADAVRAAFGPIFTADDADDPPP